MTKRLTAIIITTIISCNVIGQTDQSVYSFYFASFKWENSGLATDKISFFKNNALDSVKSKNYLDSLVELLDRNCDLIVEITRKKGSSFKFRTSVTSGDIQAQNLINYLARRIIDGNNRLVTSSSSSLPKVTDQDIQEYKKAQKEKKQIVTWTDIRIIQYDKRRTKMPKCYLINDKEYARNDSNQVLILNGKSFIKSSKKDIADFFGKPMGVFTNKEDSTWSYYRYYPKNCDNKANKGSTLGFDFQNGTVVRAFIGIEN